MNEEWSTHSSKPSLRLSLSRVVFFGCFLALSSSTKSWQWENLAPQLPILLVNCGPKILLATLCFGDTLYVFHHSKMVEIYILDHKEWTLDILFTVDEYMDPHHFWTDNSHVLSDAINRTLFSVHIMMEGISHTNEAGNTSMLIPAICMRWRMDPSSAPCQQHTPRPKPSDHLLVNF